MYVSQDRIILIHLLQLGPANSLFTSHIPESIITNLHHVLYNIYDLLFTFYLEYLTFFTPALLAGVVEYANCTSAVG